MAEWYAVWTAYMNLQLLVFGSQGICVEIHIGEFRVRVAPPLTIWSETNCKKVIFVCFGGLQPPPSNPTECGQKES